MGTRHLICVVQDGNFKVAQYGQWDGYPSGQGDDIVQFLTGSCLRRFREQIAKVRHLTPEEAQPLFVPDDATCPFSRDMGAGILSYIQQAADPAVMMSLDCAAGITCSWVYVIDLDRNVLEVFRGLNEATLTPADRFFFLEEKSSNGWHPVKLAASFAFAGLSSLTMTDLESKAAANG